MFAWLELEFHSVVLPRETLSESFNPLKPWFPQMQDLGQQEYPFLRVLIRTRYNDPVRMPVAGFGPHSNSPSMLPLISRMFTRHHLSCRVQGKILSVHKAVKYQSETHEKWNTSTVAQRQKRKKKVCLFFFIIRVKYFHQLLISWAWSY